MMMDDLSSIVIFNDVFMFLEPDDVLTGNIDIEPKM